MIHLKRVVASLALVFVLCLPSYAETILTVTVKLADGTEMSTEFTREDLQAVGITSVYTGNDYVDGLVEFEGPLMRDLMMAVGGQKAKIARLSAVNDYTVEVDVEEFFNYNVIIALRQNGEALSLRDKGPIWLIYPMSDHVELQEPAFNSRLIWQLDRVVFE